MKKTKSEKNQIRKIRNHKNEKVIAQFRMAEEQDKLRKAFTPNKIYIAVKTAIAYNNQ